MAHIPNEERRKQFIEAAIHVIRERGIGDATTRRIAEAADAPLASLHYCFRGKDELYEAVMLEIDGKGIGLLADSVTPGMGVANAVAAIMRANAKWLLSAYPDNLTEYEVFIWAIRSQKYSEIPVNSFRNWIDTLAGLLKTARSKDEPAYNYEALGRMLLALSDGYNIQDQMLSEESIAEQSEYAIKAMVRAIEAGDFNPRRGRRPAARPA